MLGSRCGGLYGTGPGWWGLNWRAARYTSLSARCLRCRPAAQSRRPLPHPDKIPSSKPTNLHRNYEPQLKRAHPPAHSPRVRSGPCLWTCATTLAGWFAHWRMPSLLSADSSTLPYNDTRPVIPYPYYSQIPPLRLSSLYINGIVHGNFYFKVNIFFSVI